MRRPILDDCPLDEDPAPAAPTQAPTAPISRPAAVGRPRGADRAGSKHHVPTDANGVPLSALLTAANRNDTTQLLPLIDAGSPIRGGVGRPRAKPDFVQVDRGDDSQPLRGTLHRRGIATAIAKRGTPHGSGLGRTRWVVERTPAWLHRFRLLAVRYERRPSIHEAFLTLGCVRSSAGATSGQTGHFETRSKQFGR